MPRNIVQVEIKNIPLDVVEEGLGELELSELAAQVENYMLRIQADEIDTLKQALLAALHFAAQARLQNQNEGGKRQAELKRADALISQLKNALNN